MSRGAAAKLIQQHREQVWENLADVARPDSRFHWDFKQFIPDFPGSDDCATRLMDSQEYAGLGQRRVFVTPDNSTEELRRQLISSGQPFLMTTYGLTRGFLLLEPADVPDGEERYAATLDGMDRFARPISLSELAAGREIGLLVTGGSVVTHSGLRFGKGHGYFDIEWAVLSELGLLTGDEIVVAIMHDCQVVDADIPGEAHDVFVDMIVTPNERTATGRGPRAPGTIRWDLIPGSEFEDLELMTELKQVLRTIRP